MKKRNLKSLKLSKKLISNFNITSLKGGKITWANAECQTQVLVTCPTLKCGLLTKAKGC